MAETVVLVVPVAVQWEMAVGHGPGPVPRVGTRVRTTPGTHTTGHPPSTRARGRPPVHPGTPRVSGPGLSLPGFFRLQWVTQNSVFVVFRVSQKGAIGTTSDTTVYTTVVPVSKLSFWS